MGGPRRGRGGEGRVRRHGVGRHLRTVGLDGEAAGPDEPHREGDDARGIHGGLPGPVSFGANLGRHRQGRDGCRDLFLTRDPRPAGRAPLRDRAGALHPAAEAEPQRCALGRDAVDAVKRLRCDDIETGETRLRQRYGRDPVMRTALDAAEPAD